MVVGLIALAVALIAIVIGSAVKRPVRLFYLMAFVVSFVGLNVHVGFTIYLSRLVLLCFLVVLLIRGAIGAGSRVWCDARILALFGALLAVQLVSALASDRAADSVRQILIYFGVMLVFVLVVTLADTTQQIIRAVRWYLAAGIVQGLYGIYQVIGGPNQWPTYQTFLVGIPTANDRTDGGYYFTPGYEMFRALGFFPGDVSHFAGYLAGILLIALALIAQRGGRTPLAYVVVVVCGLGLMLSLSRSGIVAFVAIGLPVLGYFLSSRHVISIGRLVRLTVKSAAALALVAVLPGALVSDKWRSAIDLGRVSEVLTSRLLNLIQPGDSPAFESMALHIRTRMLALDAFASSPIIGVGLGVTAKPWYSSRYHEDWYGAHSHHFNILGETGIMGAMLEWLFMAMVLFQMLRGVRLAQSGSQAQAVAIGLVAAYITIIVGNFFYAYYTNDFVWFVMGCGWALSRCIQREWRARAALGRVPVVAAVA